MRSRLLAIAGVLVVAMPCRTTGNSAAQGPTAGSLQESRQQWTEQDARSVLAGRATDHLKAAQELLEILEGELARARETERKFSDLYERGLVARQERDEAAARGASLQLRVDRQQQVCLATRLLLAELTPGQPAQASGFRPAGSREAQETWTVDLVPELANFFWHRFGKELPISAFGQTPTHDALGFDHRDGIDLALHPGSREGLAVIEYLNQRGLPFQAFSNSRSGSATGAHIHVGPASARLQE